MYILCACVYMCWLWAWSDSTGLGCCWFGSSLPDGFAFCRRLGVTYVATPAGKGLSLVV